MGFGDFLNAAGRALSDAGHAVTHAVDETGKAVGHATGWAVGGAYSLVTGDSAGGQRIEQGIDGFTDEVFFDGAMPGMDPKQIWSWFHEGPGTPSYQAAHDTLGSINQSLTGSATAIASAKALLAGGCSGQAAEQAQQAIQTAHTTLTTIGEHTATKQAAYANQVQTFTSTKNSVVKVADNPPQANPLDINPITQMDTATQVAAYQAGAHGNQQAYTSYQPPTQTHAASIPSDGTATATPTGPAPGPTGPPGPGISEPHSYSGPPGGSTRHASTVSGPVGGSQPGSPNVPGPGGSQPGVTPPGYSTPPGYTPPSSTNLTSYTGPGGPGPSSGGPGWPDPSGYGGGVDSSRAGSGGWVAGGYGPGGFGPGGSAAGGSGGASGAGRGSGPGAGNAAGAGEEALAGRGGVAGARGAAGAAGAGAAGAGGRGGKKEEDKEHKTAAYLVTEEHGNEIAGDLPPALPSGGVIGE